MDIVLAFFIGIIAAFVGAISGGGGLISIPALIFLGLPPQIALATNKLGAIGLSIGSIAKFRKEKKIIRKYSIPLCAIAIVGGVIGGKILLDIPQDTLLKVVGILLIFLFPFTFLKNIGIKTITTSNTKKTIGAIVYFFLSIFGGFFGGGSGPFMMANLMYFFGLDIIHANATDMVPRFFVSTSAFIVFIINGMINRPIGISLFIGMIIGGYIGAHVAIKKGTKRVKIFFGLIIIASAIKLLFF